MTKNILLPASHTLTVSANATSSGMVRRSAQPGDTTAYDVNELAASTAVTIGPFAQAREYQLISIDGELTYAIAAADATATSAGLIQALSDETGTGAAVFATGPTITGAILNRKVATASASGAITVESSVVKITKAGVAALTLATTATDGVEVQVISTTAHAHTITASIEDGVTGGTKTTATFAAFAGASIRLISAGSKWHVAAANNVTVS